MSIYEIIIARRSVRRFQQKPIPRHILEKMVNAARLAPSGANLQPLRYVIINEKSLCNKIFETTKWAGYLKPAWRPSENERPTAYIAILITDITNPYYQRDVGLASANIILTAEEHDIGSCILCNIDKTKIEQLLNIPDYLHVDSLIALGYKGEKIIVEEMKDSVEYWRDEQDVLHVPKRKLEDILHFNRF